MQTLDRHPRTSATRCGRGLDRGSIDHVARHQFLRLGREGVGLLDNVVASAFANNARMRASILGSPVVPPAARRRGPDAAHSFGGGCKNVNLGCHRSAPISRSAPPHPSPTDNPSCSIQRGTISSITVADSAAPNAVSWSVHI